MSEGAGRTRIAKLLAFGILYTTPVLISACSQDQTRGDAARECAAVVEAALPEATEIYVSVDVYGEKTSGEAAAFRPDESGVFFALSLDSSRRDCTIETSDPIPPELVGGLREGGWTLHLGPATTAGPASTSAETRTSPVAALAVTVAVASRVAPFEPTEVPYSAAFDDPDIGVARVFDESGFPDGPIGFGVEPDGTLHIADSTRARVLVIDPQGNWHHNSYPDLENAVVLGFAAGPDGTEYFMLNDGLLIGRAGAVIARLNKEELGWDSIVLRPRADAEGLWVQTGSGWKLSARPTGDIVVGVSAGEAVDCGMPRGHTITAQTDVAQQTIAFNVEGGGSPTPVLCSRTDGGTIVAIINDGIDYTVNVLSVISTDGRIAQGRIPGAAFYVLQRERLYVYSISKTGIEINVYDLTHLMEATG